MSNGRALDDEYEQERRCEGERKQKVCHFSCDCEERRGVFVKEIV